MNKHIIYLSIIIIPLIGCANSVKLKFESMGYKTEADEYRTTIRSLAENRIEYEIYFTATGNNPASAKGILFDPKNDDKTLVPEGEDWIKVEDQETMNLLLEWNASPFDYAGRLWRVMHPNGQFFGYLYLNIDYSFAGLRVVDEKTISVLPVRQDNIYIPIFG